MTRSLKQLLVGGMLGFCFMPSVYPITLAPERPCALVSPSFFRPRSLATDSTFELALTNYNTYCVPGAQSCVDVYIRPFYQHSYNGFETAQYFMPRHAQTAAISPNGDGELNPVWFSLVTYVEHGNPPDAPYNNQYYSFVSMEPMRSATGAFITLLAYPSDTMFLSIHSVFYRAEHDLHTLENGRSVNADVYSPLLQYPPKYRTFCQAVTNDEWTAAKIPCQVLQQVGFDDVQIKLGYVAVQHERSTAMLYAVVTAPTGQWCTFNGDYLFQPVIGSKQASVGGGVNAGGCLFHTDRSAFWVMADAKLNYFLAANERRTFDFTQNGDWSRYLLLQTKSDPVTVVPQAVPAVNINTLEARVHPGAQFQLWLALHADVHNWQLEGGYTFWFRQHERVTIPCDTYPDGVYGILDAYGTFNAGNYEYTSASQATIWLAGAAESDPIFTPVYKSDLNCSSAAHPQTGSSTWYGSAGYFFNNQGKTAVFVGLNASCETAHNYAALNQWAWWATLGLLF